MPAWVQTAVISALPNPSLACQRAVSSQGCLAHFWNKANQRYESYESYYESYESCVHYESYDTGVKCIIGELDVLSPVFAEVSSLSLGIAHCTVQLIY